MKLSKEDQEFVKQYDDSKYAKPSVTADMVIFARTEDARMPSETGAQQHFAAGSGAGTRIACELEPLEVLLIRRGRPPFQNQYALPGGFVNPDESVDDAAKRELLEETGVECESLEQLRTFSTPGRDPRRWVITCAYLALVEKSQITVQAGDDAKDAEWFSVKLEKVEQPQTNADISQEGGHTKEAPQQACRWALELCGSQEMIRIPFREERLLGQWEPKLFLESADNKLAFDHDLILAYAVMRLERYRNQW